MSRGIIAGDVRVGEQFVIVKCVAEQDVDLFEEEIFLLDLTRCVLLIDGYNVIAPVAPPGRASDPRWLERERNLLLHRLGSYLPEKVRRLTCVVFDASRPPLGVKDHFRQYDLTVLFAVNYPEADDLLEEIIGSVSSPKRLCVVSSDHRIQAAATRRAATVFDSELWIDDLVDGRVELAPGILSKMSEPTQENPTPDRKNISECPSPEEVNQWLDEFDL